MKNTDLIQYIQPFITSLETNNIDSACTYAFKTKHDANPTNKYISLKYEFFETKMPHDIVKNAICQILKYYISKKLSNDSLVFKEYSIANEKGVIDYMKLDNLDFSSPDILNGTCNINNVDSYKVSYFLNELETRYNTANTKKDYIHYKHSILKLTTTTGESLYIINKTSPIYKPKNFLFSFTDDESDSAEAEFRPVTTKLFKLPFYPNAIIVNNYCFFIEDNVESIFGFEKYNKFIRDSFLSNIKNSKIFSDESYNLIKTYSSRGGNHNLFSKLNDDRVNNIKVTPPNDLETLKGVLNIVDDNNKLNIKNEKDAEKLVLYLCESLVRDINDIADEPILYEAKNRKKI